MKKEDKNNRVSKFEMIHAITETLGLWVIWIYLITICN